jgi:hypothetical protein
MNSKVNEVEKSTLVMRLERNQKDLLQLKCKLNSYTCEPRTQSLFERIEILRKYLETLSATNTEIITSLKGSKQVVKGYMESAKKHLLEFNQLQQSVDEYVVGARKCQG